MAITAMLVMKRKTTISEIAKSIKKNNHNNKNNSILNNNHKTNNKKTKTIDNISSYKADIVKETGVTNHSYQIQKTNLIPLLILHLKNHVLYIYMDLVHIVCKDLHYCHI